MHLCSCYNLMVRLRWVVNATAWPLYPRKWPGNHGIGGWMDPRIGLDWCRKISPPPPPAFDPRPIQPLASHYTDWATSAHHSSHYYQYKRHLFTSSQWWADTTFSHRLMQQTFFKQYTTTCPLVLAAAAMCSFRKSYHTFPLNFSITWSLKSESRTVPYTKKYISGSVHLAL